VNHASAKLLPRTVCVCASSESLIIKKTEYKFGVTVYRCLHGRAPRYLADHLIPASDVAPCRRRLRSANLNRLTVPRCRLIARTAVGLVVMLARQSGTRCLMNLEIRTTLIVSNGFWKQFFSVATCVTSALQVSSKEMCHINLRFIYYLLYYVCQSNKTG